MQIFIISAQNEIGRWCNYSLEVHIAFVLLGGVWKTRYCGHTLSHLMQIRHNMTTQTRFPTIRREVWKPGASETLVICHYRLESMFLDAFLLYWGQAKWAWGHWGPCTASPRHYRCKLETFGRPGDFGKLISAASCPSCKGCVQYSWNNSAKTSYFLLK